MNTQNFALIPLARYDSDARTDGVARGLAIRTLGTIDAVLGTAYLLAITGAARSVMMWAHDAGALLVDPCGTGSDRAGSGGFEFTSAPTPRTLTPHDASAPDFGFADASAGEYAYERARGLVLRALESYGSGAIADAERARALVGDAGLDRIADTLADSGDPETAWQLRGALAALRGEPVPLVMGDRYEPEACDGFRHVESGGFLGAWVA